MLRTIWNRLNEEFGIKGLARNSLLRLLLLASACFLDALESSQGYFLLLFVIFEVFWRFGLFLVHFLLFFACFCCVSAERGERSESREAPTAIPILTPVLCCAVLCFLAFPGVALLLLPFSLAFLGFALRAPASQGLATRCCMLQQL